jgi:predicted GNAT family acetyltransferase
MDEMEGKKMKISVKHDNISQKFFTSIGGKECILRYDKISDTIWDYRMIFVPANLRNNGIAAKVVEYALQYALKNFIKVKVSCSYVKDFVIENQKYQEVLIKPEKLEVA